MKKILNILMLATFSTSALTLESWKSDEGAFLPEYEVKLSDMAKTGIGFSVFGAVLAAGGLAYAIKYNSPYYGLSGTATAFGGAGIMAAASSLGFKEDNKVAVARDYNLLLRYSRVARTTGELSWHEGISQVYGKFVCDGLEESEKVALVSELIMDLDAYAKDPEVEEPKLGACAGSESEAAAAGILAAGLVFYEKR